MQSASAPAFTPSTPHWMKDDTVNDFVQPNSGDTTSTFSGTAEYFAPEVIQGLPYSCEVVWWSFATMLYEMLTGIVSRHVLCLACSILTDLPDAQTEDEGAAECDEGRVRRGRG